MMQNLSQRVETYLGRFKDERVLRFPGPYSWRGMKKEFDYPTGLLDSNGTLVLFLNEESHGYTDRTLFMDIDPPFEQLILEGLNEAPVLVQSLWNEVNRLLAVIDAMPSREAVTLTIAQAMTKGASQMSSQEIGQLVAQSVERLYHLKTLERVVQDG